MTNSYEDMVCGKTIILNALLVSQRQEGAENMIGNVVVVCQSQVLCPAHTHSFAYA